MPGEKLLSLFWDLAANEEDARLKAAVQLIEELRVCESTSKDTKEDEDKTEEVEKETDDNYCEEIDYSVKRLVRGLASGRKAARQGFATVLTEFFLEFDIPAEKVFKIMTDDLAVSAGTKGQEERNAYFGQVFGLVALARAVISKNKDDDRESLKTIIMKLKELGSKKSYLLELCTKAVIDIIIQADKKMCSELLKCIEDDIYYGWGSCTPEVLVTVLAVQRHCGKCLDQGVTKTKWKHSLVADVKNYKRIAKVLQDSTSAHPRSHCVWKEVFSWVLEEPKGDLDLFWKDMVDENLFQTTHERKFLGFKLLEEILPKLTSSQVSTVFSSNLMRCLFNSLSSPQNYLHPAVKQFLNNLPNVAERCGDKKVVAEIIKGLVGRHGNMSFDSSTKTKTTEKLIGKLDSSSAQHYTSWLFTVFKTGSTKPLEESSQEKEKVKEWVLNQFLVLIKSKSIPRSSDWLTDVVFFMFDLAFFKIPSSFDQQGEVSDSLRQMCQQRFFSSLSELSSEPAAKKNKDDKSDVVRINWALEITKHAHELLQNEENVVTSPKWTKDVEETFNSVYKDVENISKESSTASTVSQAFQLLFLHVGLQLFSEPEQALDLLQEVQACYKKVTEVKKTVKKEEPHWMEVLTEVLLSILTQSSSLLRHVVDQVFRLIAPHMTAQAMQIILEALDPGHEGSGEDELLQIVKDEDEDEDEDEEAESSPVQNGDASDDEDSDDDSDDDDDGEEELNAVIDEAFRAEVKAALGQGALEEEDENESADEDMGDDAMMVVDEALSAVFKERLKAKQEKKDKKDTKKALLHYKLRVLDIIEIFVKKQPSNPLILDLVEPLLHLIRLSLASKDYMTLGERAQGIFKNKLCNLREYPTANMIDSEQVHLSLEKLINSAKKARSLNMVSLISKGSLFLVRVLKSTKVEVQTPKRKSKRKSSGKPVENPPQTGVLDTDRVMSFYKDALKDFMCNRGTHLHPVLFTDVIGRYPVLGWKMGLDLIQYLTEAVNNYRRGQACNMLTLLISNKGEGYNIMNLMDVAKPLQKAFIKVLTSASEEGTQMKGKHIKEVLKMASRFFKEITATEESRGILEVKKLNKSLEKAKSSSVLSRSNEMRNTCTRLAALINGDSENQKTSGAGKSKKKKKKDVNNTSS